MEASWLVESAPSTWRPFGSTPSTKSTSSSLTFTLSSQLRPKCPPFAPPHPPNPYQGHDDESIEAIDIGGPAMARAAAKNFASVVVLTSPAQYPAFIAEVRLLRASF